MIGRLRGGDRPRVVRLAAQSAILATFVAGTTAFTSMHKTVTIEVNGDLRTVSAFGRTVDDILDGHLVELTENDQVFPTKSTVVADGDLIVVRTLKELQVEIDGEMQTISTPALTVGEVLDELGSRTDGATVSASRSAAVGRTPLRISTLKDLTIAIDGQSMEVLSTAETVRDVLADMGVVLNPGDVVTPALDKIPVDGQTISVGRVASSTTTVTEVLPFAVEEVADPKLVVGQRLVRQAGKVGQSVTTYDVTLVDGVEAARTVVAQRITATPRTEIIGVGTLALPDPSTIVVDPGSARALGRSMVLAKGWGEDQFACLERLWTKESNWNVTADNPSSSAYGIPQALPGSKMASAGADWRTNAATQITWGLGYIADRYGTPCSAWAHSQAKNWY